ncbi:MAG: amidohydrolase family protein [Williamsia sp.]|nr:amidohydrolase family protein [Williamsia sp.]
MLIRNVYLFDGQPLHQASDIRIKEDTVCEIGHSLSAHEQEEVLDGKGSIALPGLTDAHRHVWQSPFKGYAADMMLLEYLEKAIGGIGPLISAEDLYFMNLVGYLEAASAGVTTIFDWSHIMNSPEHADAALQAAADAGINVLFFHSTSAIGRDKTWNNSTVTHDKDIERLAGRYHNVAPNVKLGMGIRGPEFATIDVNKADIQLANQLGIPTSMHIGSSILGKLYKPVLQLAEAGLLNNRMNMVHCNTLLAAEFSLMQQADCLVTMTPEAELQMGLGEPATKWIADCPGLKWSVGIDIVTAATNSLFFQQRLLLQHYRGMINNRLIDQMEFPMQLPYKANDFFFHSMQYANAFAGFNTSAKIEEGKKACLSLVSREGLEHDSFAHHPAFYYLDESRMHTVIANGKRIKEDGHWTQFDRQALYQKISGIVKKVL